VAYGKINIVLVALNFMQIFCMTGTNMLHF